MLQKYSLYRNTDSLYFLSKDVQYVIEYTGLGTKKIQEENMTHQHMGFKVMGTNKITQGEYIK